jgi:hypothetical protein
MSCAARKRILGRIVPIRGYVVGPVFNQLFWNAVLEEHRARKRGSASVLVDQAVVEIELA